MAGFVGPKKVEARVCLDHAIKGWRRSAKGKRRGRRKRKERKGVKGGTTLISRLVIFAHTTYTLCGYAKIGLVIRPAMDRLKNHAWWTSILCSEQRFMFE